MRFRRRAPSLISTFLLVAGVASGCQERLWDPGYRLVPPEGGVVDVPKTDGSTDGMSLDLTGLAGRGGVGGSINIGGAGGSGGGAGGTGGGVPTCDNNSPDRLSDIANCGTCFHSCLVPNSDPLCIGGQC